MLVMASSLHTCTLIKDYLNALDSDAPRGAQGRRMMEDKLRLYLWWKGKLAERKADGRAPIALPQGRGRSGTDISEALKRKDREKLARAANRRRIRGGAPAATVARGDAGAGGAAAVGDVEIKQERMTSQRCVYPLLHTSASIHSCPSSLSTQGVEEAAASLQEDFQMFSMDDDFDAHYGLLAHAQTVLVRPYSDDSDDQMLQEIKPRFIVMYEPNLEFIRRLEVRRPCSAETPCS